MIVTMPGTEAAADPTSLADIEAQIRDVWNQAEPLIEEYNSVHDNFVKNQAQQQELEKKLAPLRTQVDLAQLRIGAIAAEVYKRPGMDTFNAVLSSGSPEALADQLTFLEQMTLSQERQIEGVNAVVEDYNAQKAPLDKIVADLAVQDADLAAKKADIEGRLNELQKLRIKLYGSSGGTGSFRPWPCPSAYEPTSGYKVAAFACKQAGLPYKWAASGPSSYDCSGLTMKAWQQVGVYLPHNAADQRKVTTNVTRANLQLGDLVFFYSPIHHVGIYVGDGKIMHAPSAGDNVRMAIMDDAGPINSFGRP
jgi:cell wall-associated NlpC family hydrolase